MPRNHLGTAERDEAAWLIERALAEDLPRGDITVAALFGGPAGGSPLARMRFVARESGVLCGAPVVELLYQRIDPSVGLERLQEDGGRLDPGTAFLEVTGPASSVLQGERIALNALGRLSGIASVTARWVSELEGTSCVLLDTRKTTPAWRYLEKYAVRCGGGTNHRLHLSDDFLVKDNHASVLRAAGDTAVADWVRRLRSHAPQAFLEIEVDSREQFLEARRAQVDAILLDNFSLEDLRRVVEENRREAGSPVLLEASGGIRLENARAVALTGVDRISTGALTHSPGALDVGLDDVDREGYPGP